LSDIDRQIIELGVRKKKGIREIAAIIGRSHSIVSREIRSESGASGYRRQIAARVAGERARKTNKRKLDKDVVLADHVRTQIRLGLSPEQIAGQLKAQPVAALHGSSVSHEAIYAWMYDGNGRDCCFRFVYRAR